MMASAVALGIVLLGFLGVMIWVAVQLFSHGDNTDVPEWKPELARSIGVPPVFTPTPELTLEIEGTLAKDLDANLRDAVDDPPPFLDHLADFVGLIVNFDAA